MAYTLTELVRVLERIAYEIEKCHKAGQKVTEADWLERLRVLIEEIQKTPPEKMTSDLIRRAVFALDRIRQIHPDTPDFRDDDKYHA